ncbi:MAG: hypothetical protein IJ759_00015 [Bacteroidales bacterium]|nr:hypothetical protein [Bacteroidales bacterium]
MDTLNIKSVLGNNIILREDARNIIHYIKENNIKVLDFQGVDFVSRSFADEIYSYTKNNAISIINTNEVIDKMFRAVQHTHNNGRQIINNIEILPVNSDEELSKLLLAY